MTKNEVAVVAEEFMGQVPNYLLYGSGKLLLGTAFLLYQLHNASMWLGKKAISKAYPVGQKSEVVSRDTTCQADKERVPVVTRSRIDEDSEAIPKSSPESTAVNEQLSTDSLPDSTGEGTPLNAMAIAELNDQVAQIVPEPALQ